MPPPCKTRSFTVSHPPPIKSRKSVKRTKTYTGCWTCRGRGTKCDETKPECQRCIKSKIHCDGYGVRLVWEDEQTNARRVQRRTFLSEQISECPVLTDDEIKSALDMIEATEREPTSAITASYGPFSVFVAASSESPSHVGYDCEPSNSSVTGSPVLCPGGEDQESLISESVTSKVSTLDSTGTELDFSTLGMTDEQWAYDAITKDDQIEVSEAAQTMISIKQKIQPQIMTYVSSASLEERSLLHYWITVLSGMMLPTPRYDNPFRTIFIPLALAVSDSTKRSSGNVALLHAIYAVSAFNRAQLPSSLENFADLGMKHHELSLRYLRKALSQTDTDSSHKEAVLATIITMSSIEVMMGGSATWRTHVVGGKSWLTSTIANDAMQSDNFWALCQIFICIDVLGNPGASARIPRGLLEEQYTDHNVILKTVLDKPYRLESWFGIAKPTLEAVTKIKTLLSPTRHVTTEEVDDLENYIRLNDPDVLISDLNDSEDSLIRHHMCAFFCATLIYFERSLRHTPVSKLQRLVRRSLDHFDAIRDLEITRGYDVCGLLWPEFITACETANVLDLRSRSLLLFEKGRTRGIGNVVSAEQIVLDVWEKRDGDTSDDDISWESSMANLGLDIILT